MSLRRSVSVRFGRWSLAVGKRSLRHMLDEERLLETSRTRNEQLNYPQKILRLNMVYDVENMYTSSESQQHIQHFDYPHTKTFRIQVRFPMVQS